MATGVPELDIPTTPEQWREHLVAAVTQAEGPLDPVVENALRTVPRHVFTGDDVPLQEAYDFDTAVVTKRDADGRALSSVSAAWLQSRMLHHARLGPGSRVLEIGSGVRHEVAHCKWSR